MVKELKVKYHLKLEPYGLTKNVEALQFIRSVFVIDRRNIPEEAGPIET